MIIPPEPSSSLTALFQAVLHASWQGSLAVVLVLLARRAFGARVPARWHYLLWFLVLARLLAPTASLPHNPASLENLPTLGRPFERSTLPSTPPTVGTNPGPVAPAPRAAGPTSAGPGPRQMPARTGRRPVSSWWKGFAWTWLGGVLGFGGWLTACALRLHRRMTREGAPVDEGTQNLWHLCCRRWLGRTPPKILVVDWIRSPALVGWWRPTLLVPRPALTDFSAQDWEHVFAHEIAHLRWRDHRSQTLVLAAWCVHWFNPVVWIGFRRLRADRELAADEWVLKHLEGERALAYGETLFKTVASRPAQPAFQPGMVGISEDGAQMKQRLRRIADFLPRRRIVGSLVGLGVLLVLATVVLGQGEATPGASPKEALTSAAQAGDLNAMRAALAKGVPVDANPTVDKKDPYQAAAEEGQDEALALLLATRKPDADPAELRWALREAVWNCHPYDNQRSVEHFERCAAMLLAAGAPVSGYQKERDLMAAAVFSRNPGGNPKVMEMLAHAGVDPNPTLTLPDKSQTRLLEAVQKACAEGQCSTPVAETLVKLIQLAPARQQTGGSTDADARSVDGERRAARGQADDARPVHQFCRPRVHVGRHPARQRAHHRASLLDAGTGWLARGFRVRGERHFPGAPG